MFISCRHMQQSQSIVQFINKLSRRTAVNIIEIKYNTQISTGNSWVSHNAVTQLIQTEATNERIPEHRIKL